MVPSTSPSSTDVEYGVDLVTFYHPGFWGLVDAEEMRGWCAAHPRDMWERMLDALVSGGVTAVELTFPPLDFHSAVAAFGSGPQVRTAFAERSLRVVSGFLNGLHWGSVGPSEAVAESEEYLDFLQATGATVVVVGTPMIHESRPDAEARAALLAHLAPVCDAVGAAAADRGLALAVHTESHSITVDLQDIRTLMASTNPGLVGLCPDAAHLTLSGTDPVAVATEFAERVQVSHWKDAVGPMPGGLEEDPALFADVHAVHRRYMSPLGSGAVDWSGWAKAMAGTPTAGLRLLELDSAADPVSQLVAARAFADRL